MTRALKTLQSAGGIALRRGGLQVLEVPALATLACPCHNLAEARYERVFARGALRELSDRASIFHNPEIFIR